MFKIGLTGGIGSGKTTAADFFHDLGAHIVDADQIGRQLTEKGQPCLDEIRAHFGNHVLTKEGFLNRLKMKKLLFSNQEEKQWLENLLHPLIKKQIKEESERDGFPYCIIVAPLLLEAKATGLVDRILTIETTVDNQVSRVIKRDHIEKELVLKIIYNQVEQSKRLVIADDVIFNDGTSEELKEKVDQLHLKYLKLGERQDGSDK